ncbi:histone-lysine N-methyltransferase SETD1B isoform X2 [Drosophila yakuba]|uniref:Uncharacterized protein n=1 Tax=Drosophila yakuba TaxID=7245 RepID=B4PY20_DROYA|nr:histone-lysine N-methyltransferase SETD1B isoform X2 [Drosophila yakuba]EDX02992.1 uncharacterized protein Dyak_GE17869 [Drosophila yakuba]
MASDTADSKAHMEVDLSTSESEPTSSGDTDSEDASSKVAAPDTSPQTSMYSLLAGESDNELEEQEQEQEQEDFCEETISLLAHEILCCEGDSDSEVETDGEDIDEARNNDRLAEILQFGLHNPYRPMLSDEDEDEEEEGCYPIVSETIFLLDEDQQSEEKSDSSKRSF